MTRIFLIWAVSDARWQQIGMLAIFLSFRREIIIPWLGSHGVTRLLRECMCGATPIHKLLAKRSHVRIYVGQRCTCLVGLPHVHTCAYAPSPDVRQPLLWIQVWYKNIWCTPDVTNRCILSGQFTLRGLKTSAGLGGRDFSRKHCHLMFWNCPFPIKAPGGS